MMTTRFADLCEEQRAARCSIAERIAMLDPALRGPFLKSLPARLRGAFLLSWEALARPLQQAPEGDWRIWMIMAGRGCGKTRAGAQWVLGLAKRPGLRIALVGPTEEETRAVMIEGPSGILECAGPMRPLWEPSLGKLTWPN